MTCESSCAVPGTCPPDPCTDTVTIDANDDNIAANQSLGFYRSCVLDDMNGDGFVSIVGDVPCFVDYVYFSAQQPRPTCEGEVPCACDCNGDGFCSILGDVPCFVDCLYFSQCTQATAAVDHASDTAGKGFTVGGAIYADRGDPLVTGVEGVGVELLDASGTSIALTRTGRLGIWKVEALPAGAYTVVFHTVQRDGSVEEASRAITVAEGNEVAMQSIQLHLPVDSPRQEPQPRKVRRNPRR